MCLSSSKKSVLFYLFVYSKTVPFVKSSNTTPAIWFTLRRVFKKFVKFFLLSKYIKVNISQAFLWKTKGKCFYRHLRDNNKIALYNGHGVVSICVTRYFYRLFIEYSTWNVLKKSMFKLAFIFSPVANVCSPTYINKKQ